MDLNKFYAQEYDPTKSYSKNDRCVYNGEWYECLDNTTGEFDTTKWKKRYLVEYIGGGTSASVDTWQEWAKAGGVDTSLYSSLDDLLSDEVAIRRLMTVHASADYLLNWVNTDESIMPTFIADTNAMKWIGLRDYICDKLMAIDTVKTAMLSSDNWEYILKDHVPIMTSNTAPYGEASASSVNPNDGKNGNIYQPWASFSGNSNVEASLCWHSAMPSSFASQWLQYKFVNPVNVKRISIQNYYGANCLDYFNYEIWASNDDFSTHTVLHKGTLDAKNNSSGAYIYVDIENDNYYLSYRYVITSKQLTVHNGVFTENFQFYGRALNVSVPTMTSNTAPYGEAIGENIYNASQDKYKAFDGDITATWATNTAKSNSWIGYKFNKQTVVKKAQVYYKYDHTNLGKVQSSNDGITWTDCSEEITFTANNGKWYDIDITKISNRQYYRIYYTKTTSDNYFNTFEIQFYGVDYSEREFAEGSTMKYLYDHGIELVPIDTYTTNTGVVEKRDNEIYLYQGTNAQSNANIHTQSSIDLSPYSIERCIVGDEFIQNSATSSHWVGYANNTTGNAIGYSYIYPYIPNHAYIDVSSVNSVYYPTIAQNNINTSKIIITEWWLE